MVESNTISAKMAKLLIYVILTLIALLSVAPMVHTVAVSLSSPPAAAAGMVKLWPVDFNINAYAYVLHKAEFLHSILISVKRVVLGVSLNMLMIVLIAYPLSKEVRVFRLRTVYVWIFFLTALFNGGLVPSFMVVKQTGILNTIWALILPNAVPVFSVLLLLNFFRGLPKELEESAWIDGAGSIKVMWSIYLPLSVPALATLVLFTTVNHWNAWFDGLIYMNSPDKYPLQSYLQTVIIKHNLQALTIEDEEMLKDVSSKTFRAAQILLGALPVLLLYPFLQKYFSTGIVLGSVKG